MKVTNTPIKNQQQKPWSNKESQTAGTFTGHMTDSQEIFVSLTNKNKPQPSIISQDDKDPVEANAHPASNTRAKQAIRMPTQECALSAIQIPQQY